MRMVDKTVALLLVFPLLALASCREPTPNDEPLTEQPSTVPIDGRYEAKVVFTKTGCGGTNGPPAGLSTITLHEAPTGGIELYLDMRIAVLNKISDIELTSVAYPSDYERIDISLERSSPTSGDWEGYYRATLQDTNYASGECTDESSMKLTRKGDLDPPW